MGRTLLFNFDGTWNGRDDQFPTNILKLHQGLTTPTQVSFYFEGPGNEEGGGSVFSHFLGGAFGVGSWAIRDAALDVLRAVYQPGDRVATTGFSRGAGVSRMFANAIFKNMGIETCFLGCFDTVGAYLPFGPSQQGLFHDLHVSQGVQKAAHAVAIHEDRAAFEPNLMNAREGVTEMWFPGVHCDVGGGFEETGLSDVALNWMIQQLAKSHIYSEVPRSPNLDTPIGHVDGLFRRQPRVIGVKVDGEFDSSKAPLIFGAG